MASTDHTASPHRSEEEHALDASLTELTDLSIGADGVRGAERDPGEGSRPASVSSASGLSLNKGGEQSPAVTGSTNPPLGMPHMKRFNRVDINRKFLSASTPTHPPSVPQEKTANRSQKPAPQTTTPHPRLVTAKLTGASQPTNIAGWSRPSSVVPSNAPTPVSIPSSKPPSTATIHNTAPLPAPVGRVIQPQPRSTQDATLAKRDTSAKPVWDTPTVILPIKLEGTQTDFPTAAEVAQAERVSKTYDKPFTDATTSHKEAVMAEIMAEEDTFRGVHLDPNAHHWDEMEEDDDNFLAGVIEFEDGRQYEVQPTDAPRQPSPSDNSSKKPPHTDVEFAGLNRTSDGPVSKEDRLPDDFDRSWPPSRQGINPSLPSREQRSNGTATSPSSTSLHSPQEASKVLFNERSNRLEPYSHQRYGGPSLGPGQYPNFNRRDSRSEHSTSPTERRRDAPPHAHQQGVQLLQKGPSHTEALTFSRAPGDRHPLAATDGPPRRERQPPRREHPSWHVHEPASPDHSRAGTYGVPHTSARTPRDAPWDDRRRSSAVVLSFADTGGDNRRQLPPHLSAAGSRHGSLPRMECDVAPSPVSSHNGPAQSEPSAPSTSLHVPESPTVPSTTTWPTADLEEARKAAMHSAAERAKLRRQQEEEARERDKERARKKAAEIEERMKVQEQGKNREREKADTEAQILGIIEQAVSSVATSGKEDSCFEDVSRRSAATRPSMGRAPSSRGTSRSYAIRRTSFSSSGTTPAPLSEAESWRHKPDPALLGQRNQLQQAEPLAPTILHTPVLAHNDLHVKEGEDVDVVDFADLGKLVDTARTQQHAADAPSGRSPRTVAADFFDDETSGPPRSQLPPFKEGPWRRQPSLVNQHPSVPEKPVISLNTDNTNCLAPFDPEHTRASEPAGASVAPSSHDEHHRRVSGQWQNGAYKPPAGPHYREAPMATLDDVISRIKGALDGMHHGVGTDTPKEAAKSPKWLIPAMRSKVSNPDFLQTEVFDVTSVEPPNSSSNVFTVKLSPIARPILPPFKAERPGGQRHQRLEVYSFTPPIDTLHRRGHLNNVLFDRPLFVKGQPQYTVQLPRTRTNRRPPVEQHTPASPIVNLPATPPRLHDGHLKESVVAGRRKTPVSPVAIWRPLAKDITQEELDTVSRSPPPVVLPSLPSMNVLPPTEILEPSAVPTTNIVVKSKMPLGSDVAFYRNVQVAPIVEARAPVQFMMGSELEAQVPPEVQPTDGATTESDTIHAKVMPIEVVADVASINIRDLTNGTTTPPQPQPSLSQWSKSPKTFTLKESPARAPDPELLKAVWSQTSDKAQIPPVNSLKGIADDLTGVPFSLQDVKSDDGATPPPSSAGPWTRMSAYEVTRAFQQVPASSSNSSQRHPQFVLAGSPSATNGSAPRNPGFAFSPPPPIAQSSVARTTYPAYSPMMGHAPSPAVMYSHASPVARHVIPNGNPPAAYGQAVWMPGASPHGAGLLPSPYPSQIAPYPSPPGGVPMYPSPMPGMQHMPPQQNGAQGRHPMPLVSPVLQPALPPIYAGSPVLVHAHAAQSYAVPAQGSRGPARPYEQNPGTQHIPSPMRQGPQNGYPVSSYARPPW